MPDYAFTVRVRNEKVERITVYSHSNIDTIKMKGKHAKRVAKLLFKKSIRKRVTT